MGRTRPIESSPLGLPRCPLPLEVPLCDERNNWARNQLMAAGSDLLGKVYNIQCWLAFTVWIIWKVRWDFDLETLYRAVSGKACVTICESYPLIKGINASQQHIQLFRLACQATQNEDGM
ncbi:hypothetical protein RchiOBHm_Chr1g0320611 [Rosa chinensis]|uniref:Uncharacterized protein n=1 Tax=Rosa chinensis TaxID=74649 RepID=A0A2P6S8U4_ROSCH|nr:hypothetical protein RchiOBHm_Chr1g0320611 [Rosa chinensis]